MQAEYSYVHKSGGGGRAGLCVGWKKGKRAALHGYYGSKVALVKSQEPSCAVAVSQHNNREISQAKVEGGIAVVDRERKAVFLRRQSIDAETACGKVFEKPPRGGRASALADQIVNLGSDGRGDDKRPKLTFEEPANSRMLRITRITQGNQGRGIDDKSQLPNPRSNSSSGTSATEVPSPSHAPVRANARVGSRRDSYAAMAARTISA